MSRGKSKYKELKLAKGYLMLCFEGQWESALGTVGLIVREERPGTGML